MQIDLVKHLTDMGLNTSEAAVYTALLSSGATTVSLLAKLSGIKRGTVYNTIDALISKGLVHHEIQGAKKLVAADDPKKLSMMIDKQKQTLDAVLPRLLALHTTNRPSETLIAQFHGLQGIQSVYSDLLDSLKDNDEYLVISNQDKWYHLYPEFFENFINKRSRLKLDIKLLLQDTPHAREFTKKQKKYNQTIKILPKHISLNINMVITPHKTVIIQLIDPVFALVIENQSLVDMNRVLFNLLWDVFG